jgi:coenzyme F420-reducing hydrogenase alpha subunit
VACELFDFYWQMSIKMKERIGTWGDDAPAHYITSTGTECPDYDSNDIRVLAPEGVCCQTFSPRHFREHLTFEETDYSFAGRTSYQGQVMRANSLARANMTSRMGTPRADEYLQFVFESFGRPAHPILLFDLCRGVELSPCITKTLLCHTHPVMVRATGWWKLRVVRSSTIT